MYHPPAASHKFHFHWIRSRTHHTIYNSHFIWAIYMLLIRVYIRTCTSGKVLSYNQLQMICTKPYKYVQFTLQSINHDEHTNSTVYHCCLNCAHICEQTLNLKVPQVFGQHIYIYIRRLAEQFKFAERAHRTMCKNYSKPRQYGEN